MLPTMYILMYLQTVCFSECFITPITVVWNLPSMYTLMYLQTICFTECMIKHTTGVCTFHSMYPTLKRKKGLILLFWKEVKTLWNVSYRSVIQILYQKTCVLYQIPLTHWSRITSKDVTNSVSKFGGILFTHHHHHVPEGLGMLACSLIPKMKLVPPSLPRSSYVSSSVCKLLVTCQFINILAWFTSAD